MLELIKKLLLTDKPESKILNGDKTTFSQSDEEKKLHVATCALFVEIAKADSEFTSEEKNKIISIMKEAFKLEDYYVNELLELAEQEVYESVSIYEFTSIINQHFSEKEKFELLKDLWRLIYVDDQLHKYEDVLIKRIGGTLNLEHQKIIGAKLLVKEEIERSKQKL
jgi:uncharacterized tellurite resistance protein B-like protein